MDLPYDIEIMVRFLGRDDPAVQRLVCIYLRDSRMRGTVRTLLKRRCRKLGFNPDNPPTFMPVRELPAGTLHVGRALRGEVADVDLRLPETVTMQHTGIFGTTGVGKTSLAMYLARQAVEADWPVWIFDLEDEYVRLLPSAPSGRLAVLEPAHLRFNFFQPPGDWISAIGWLDELILLLRGETYLRDGSLNLFRVGGARLLEHHGVMAGGSHWPSLLQATEYFKGIRFGPKSRSAGYAESLVNRLVTLSDIFAQTAAVSASDQLQKLTHRSVIFRLHELVGMPLQTLVGFLLLWLMRFREGTSANRPHMVILEEPHMLASDQSRQDIGEGLLSRVFRTARKRGIALILCDQVPSELPPAILANLACRTVMRLPNDRCIRSMQSSMGLDRWQVKDIAQLPLRRAVVHYALHSEPFAVEIPEMEYPSKPDESELHQRSEEMLRDCRWTTGVEPGRESVSTTLLTPSDLAGDPLRVMVRICEAPAELIEQRCEILRMDRAREFRARAELDARGLIRQVEQTLGGKSKFFRPTDKGLLWASQRKIRVKKFKSGIVHEYLLCEVEKRIGVACQRWRLQRNSTVARDQGLQPDLLVLGPAGQRTIVEICCTNLKYDAENILAEVGTSGIDRVVAVTPDKRTKKSLHRVLVERFEGITDFQDCVVVLDATECLAEDFDWKRVVQ